MTWLTWTWMPSGCFRPKISHSSCSFSRPTKKKKKIKIPDSLKMMIRSILFFFFMVSLSFPIRLCSSTITEIREEEKTLAMIKPDGLLGNYTERIKEVILQSGFSIVTEITTQLDQHRASTFYDEHSSRSFFSNLIEYMTSGPVLAMVLKKENAVADWRTLIGPTDARKAKITHPASIRAMCGLDSEKNCVHGSDSLESAQREISFFFGELSPGEAVGVHDEL